MSALEVVDVSKRFGGVTALAPTDLTIAEGEFVVIVGPSGCGKSTLLRLIAGLEEPSGGRILIGGRDVTEAPPAERGVGMVFQSYALYPHLTVAQNIGFPLSVARRPRAEIDRRVRAVAEQLELTEVLDRRPAALSGGQRQRVSIGRAIVRDLSVLMLDEPLSNLDAALRARMRHEFARLHQRLGVTMLYVTHDQLEAMTLAERIVVMDGGRVQQIGPPLEVYRRPANLKVAAAIGSPAINFMPVAVVGIIDGGVRVRLPGGAELTVAVRPPDGSGEGRAATLGVRPEHLRLAEHGPFSGRVELFERLGPTTFVHLADPAAERALVAQLPVDDAVRLGETLRFEAAPGTAMLFGDDGAAWPAR